MVGVLSSELVVDRLPYEFQFTLGNIANIKTMSNNHERHRSGARVRRLAQSKVLALLMI